MACKIAVRNLLKDAVVEMTPAAEPDLGEQYLSDGPGGLGAMFGDLTADPVVVADLSVDILGQDGSVEGANSGDTIAVSGAIGLSLETDWSVVTQSDADGNGYLSVADDAGIGTADHGGNDRSLFMATDESIAIAKLSLTVHAGAAYRMGAWAMKLGDDLGQAGVRLYDPVSGTYLHTGGTWGSINYVLLAGTFDAGVTWFGVNSGAGVDFTAPGDLGDADVTLELQLVLQNGGASQGRWDDISLSLLKAADLMMVAGNHNIPLSAAPVWKTSDDGVSWTTRATFTVAKGQFWAVLTSPVTARFHSFTVPGTPIVKYFLGELILAATQVFPRTAMEKLDVTYDEMGQARLAGPAGVEYVANRGPYPVRTLAMTNRLRIEAEEVTAREILIDGLRGGANECVVFPATKHFPRLAIFGRILQPITFTMATQGTPLDDDDAEAGALEHYSDLSWSVREGQGFEVDD